MFVQKSDYVQMARKELFQVSSFAEPAQEKTPPSHAVAFIGSAFTEGCRNSDRFYS
jgi:hypothetical protein